MQKVQIVTERIDCFHEIIYITNQRVLYWEKLNSLILSDLHIGKSAHFQKSGIPIPSSVLENDLNRLQQLIEYFKATTLIIVGDLFHAAYNKDLELFKTWLSNFTSLKIQLIKGNHDRLKTTLYQDFNIELFNKELQVDTFKFVHDFVEIEKDVFTISGHTHPGVFLKGKGRQRIKLPCFQVTKNQLILPAFSLFTGLNTKDAPKNCINYAFTEKGIFKV